MRVLFLYLPLPIFWALFDQQGSRWTLQASQMDGFVTKDFRIKPDQIQSINPLIIIVMIPLFEYAVYPFFARFGMLKKPLQRIVVGGLLGAVAFVVCAIFQLQIEKGLPIGPSANQAQIVLVNGLDCQITIPNGEWLNATEVKLASRKINNQLAENSNDLVGKNFTVSFQEGCNFNQNYKEKSVSFPFSNLNGTNGAKLIYFITYDSDDKPTLISLVTNDLLEKSEDTGARVKVLFSKKHIPYITPDRLETANAQFLLSNKANNHYFSADNTSYQDYGLYYYTSFQEVEVIKGGPYHLTIPGEEMVSVNADNLEGLLNETLNSISENSIQISRELDLKQGAAYIVVIGAEVKIDLQIGNLLIRSYSNTYFLLGQTTYF